ncbi:MAG: type II toxin-antitoxin system prevent-host-death family antitoxin [Sphingorhabdus sp.]
MGIHVNIGEAKNRLSELIAASLRGEEVILSKAGKPVARILALDEAKADAKAERAAKWDAYIGSGKGTVDPDFDWFAPTFSDDEIESFTKFPDE